ncbi:hypothetical protein P9112_000685 [Eukaryota sp. TZLM1-RC]
MSDSDLDPASRSTLTSFPSDGSASQLSESDTSCPEIYLDTSSQHSLALPDASPCSSPSPSSPVFIVKRRSLLKLSFITLSFIAMTLLIFPIALWYIYHKIIKTLKESNKVSLLSRSLTLFFVIFLFFSATFLRFFISGSSFFTFAFFAISDFSFGLIFALSFCLLLSTAVHYLLLRFSTFSIQKPHFSVLIVGLIGTVLLFLIGAYFATNIKTTTYNISTPHIQSPLKIGIATDLHLNGVYYKQGLLDKIRKKSLREEVDTLFLLGDIIDIADPQQVFDKQDIYTSTLSTVAPYGTFAVLGNHDRISGTEETSTILRDGGITLLSNEAFLFRDEVLFYGLHDYRSGEETVKHFHYLSQQNASLPVSIVLVHQPHDELVDALNDLNNPSTFIMLAGHTHNGQVFPGNLIVPLVFTHNYGHYQYGNNHVVVSSGIATWGPLIRLFTRSEFVVININ